MAEVRKRPEDNVSTVKMYRIINEHTRDYYNTVKIKKFGNVDHHHQC